MEWSVAFGIDWLGVERQDACSLLRVEDLNGLFHCSEQLFNSLKGIVVLQNSFLFMFRVTTEFKSGKNAVLV